MTSRRRGPTGRAQLGLLEHLLHVGDAGAPSAEIPGHGYLGRAVGRQLAEFALLLEAVGLEAPRRRYLRGEDFLLGPGVRRVGPAHGPWLVAGRGERADAVFLGADALAAWQFGGLVADGALDRQDVLEAHLALELAVARLLDVNRGPLGFEVLVLSDKYNSDV